MKRQVKLSGISGFTIMEALVATSLSAVIMSLIIGGVLSFRAGFYSDVVRTRINGNLRSAMDIISMNIRQAGENLQSSFPAVLVGEGSSDPDTLTLRRNLVPEILTLCSDVSNGASTLLVSSTSMSNSQCIQGNVAPLHEVFEDMRALNSGSMRIYIYDRDNLTGEFVDYTNGGQDADNNYYLTVSEVGHDYDRLNTGIYLIEEYSFELNSAQETLELYIDGTRAEPRAVAFGITDFQVSLRMADETILQAFDETSEYVWKDIEQIEVSLSGEETYKDEVTSSSITAQYFPRNVLSFDG